MPKSGKNGHRYCARTRPICWPWWRKKWPKKPRTPPPPGSICKPLSHRKPRCIDRLTTAQHPTPPTGVPCAMRTTATTHAAPCALLLARATACAAALVPAFGPPTAPPPGRATAADEHTQPTQETTTMTKATTPLQTLHRVQAALEAAQAYPEGQHPPEVLNELADALQAAPESYRQYPGMDEWMRWAQNHTERRQHARFFELLEQLNSMDADTP